MAKRKKSLIQIKREISSIQIKKSRIQARKDLEEERMEAERQLKLLKRSASTDRNILLARRTGRQLKIIGKAGLGIAKRQIKRIQEQQLRDEAIERKLKLKKIKALKVGKKIKKGAKKIRKELPSQVFGGLDF